MDLQLLRVADGVELQLLLLLLRGAASQRVE